MPANRAAPSVESAVWRNLFNMPFVRLVPLTALAWFVACGGRINAESGDAATRDVTIAPAACSWSPSFEPLDAEPMRDSCRAARMLVKCTGTDGSGSICLNDREQCEVPNRPGVTYTCVNQCKPTEFAAKCGDLMGTSVVPPAECPLEIT